MFFCGCDADYPEFFREVVRKAKKEHVCTECFRCIEIGEFYEYVCGLWDGHFLVYKTCSFCLDLRYFMTDLMPCFCIRYGGLREDAREALSELTIEEKDFWIKGMRIYLKSNRLKKKKLLQKRLLV